MGIPGVKRRFITSLCFLVLVCCLVSWYILYWKNTAVSHTHSRTEEYEPRISSDILKKAIHASTLYFRENRKGVTNTIPSIIHQIWYAENDANIPEILQDSSKSFQTLNKEAVYLLWQKRDIDEFIATFFPSFNSVFSKIPKHILKADFLRFLLLLYFGGIYSDIDTFCLKPISNWTNGLNEISLITGYEASLRDDLKWQQHPVGPKPLARDVQLTVWSLGACPFHPLVSKVIQSALQKATYMSREQLQNYDVLEFAGPGQWTDIVMDHIKLFGFTPDDVYHADDPIIAGDVYILPQAGFRWTGQGNSELACVRHNFLGSWKGNL
eukprot:jgi/Galph1/2065/GphlegSOOS_G764.1